MPNLLYSMDDLTIATYKRERSFFGSYNIPISTPYMKLEKKYYNLEELQNIAMNDLANYCQSNQKDPSNHHNILNGHYSVKAIETIQPLWDKQLIEIVRYISQNIFVIRKICDPYGVFLKYVHIVFEPHGQYEEKRLIEIDFK